MSHEYEQTMNAHEHYRAHHKRWRYLYHSYMGGEVYRKGEYLTKYSNESESEYQERLMVTPLDNHCRGVISVYNSFLFRKPAHREWGSLENDPARMPFEQDADLDGRSLNAFMKDVSTYASVFGHTWVIVSKPNSNARTRAEELEQGVRPYLSVLTPLSVLDWQFTRSASGHFTLSYLKYIEEKTETEMVIREWTQEAIVTKIVDEEKKELKSVITEDNQLGVVPAVIVYDSKSPKRGIGISTIADISDLQRAIYNEYSEIEQNIRLSGHPSLVKVGTTEAGSGPGAIIQMDEGMDPGLKPYLLQPSGASISALYESINNKVAAIDRIAHLGAIRETESRTVSGVSRQVEFEQLNARLSEKADNLELAEEQIMRLFAQYQGTVWDGAVDYPDSFNIRDGNMDLDFYIKSLTVDTGSETQRKDTMRSIAKLTMGDDHTELDAAMAEIDAVSAPTTTFASILNGNDRANTET